MKILLTSNKYKKDTGIMAREVAEKLQKMGINTIIDDGFADLPIESIDAVIVLGGDGTILRAARQYAPIGIPVLGVNMGTVGFLSNIEVSELDNYINSFIKRDYEIDERMMLEVSFCQGEILLETFYCLNEVAIKSRTPRTVVLNVKVDEQALSAYRGDGLIVATPTGSTAYSLSSGGPIIDPDLEVFVITPIASYIISKKPLVIAADKAIRITSKEYQEAVISIDGQLEKEFAPGYQLEIKKAGFPLKLIKIKKFFFFRGIDSKLRRSEGIYDV